MSDIFDTSSSSHGAAAENATSPVADVAKSDRRGLAALHRQVAAIGQFDVVARKGAAVDQWLSANYGPAQFADCTEQVRSYHRPFGRGARVFAGVDRRDGVLWVVRQHSFGEWETVWPR